MIAGDISQVSDHNTAVLRRSANFYMAIQAKDRPIDLNRDALKIIFEFGKEIRGTT